MRMKRATLLRATGVTIVLAGAASAACVESPRQAEVRFRVTVIIDDGGVERRGSAVWSSELRRPILPLVDTYNAKFRADAIPIKLGNGGFLFILPADYDPGQPGTYNSVGVTAGSIPGNLFGSHVSYREDDKISLYKAINEERPKGQLVCPKAGIRMWERPAGTRIPTLPECFQLAYSANPAVIKDLQRYDPQCAYFNAKCALRIKSATVEITNDPVSRPLTSILPWMRGDYDFTGMIGGRDIKRLGVSEVIYNMRS